ncbi:type II secretion system protein [Dehalogenimonas sp. 4OHTPN]|uniref:Type II secretion system protein n=1 Tax=Dehalogenimonas sp. 4OHTPN TaxID=3166643 RepID=A0AAU8GAJ5_9CHLR
MAAPVNNRIRLKKNGFSFIEVLIAMLILTVVGVAFLITLQYALRANMLDDAKSTAESLARSQLESIKKEAYLDFSKVPVDPLRPKDAYDIVSFTGDFAITVTVEPVDPTTGILNTKLPGSPEVWSWDRGIQKITVVVQFDVSNNPNVWDGSVTIEGYKVNR